MCHLDAKRKPAIRQLIEAGVRRGRLVPLAIEGAERLEHWAVPDTLDALPEDAGERVHLLSPFDPLIIQRRRLKLFFDYEHRYEAYVPKEKRVFGYFALPVRMGDEIVAAIDFKTTERKNGCRSKHGHGWAESQLALTRPQSSKSYIGSSKFQISR